MLLSDPGRCRIAAPRPAATPHVQAVERRGSRSRSGGKQMTSRKERSTRAPRSRVSRSRSTGWRWRPRGDDGRCPPPDTAKHPLLQPLDAQNWVDQAELTWDGLHSRSGPPRGTTTSGSTGSQSQYRTAVILLQFQDQPFLITQPAGTHPFGNPQPGWTAGRAGGGRGLVPRLLRGAESVQRRPDAPRLLDGGQPRQDRRRRRGVRAVLAPGKLHEYGIPDGSFNAPAASVLPAGRQLQQEHPHRRR